MAHDAPRDPPDGPASARSGVLAALAHRDFAFLWTGQALSAVGNQMFPIIIAVLVLQRGSGAAGLGLVLAVQGIALIAGTALAAAIGDRWRRSRTMLCTDVIRGCGVAAIAVSPVRLATGALLVILIVTGIAEGMFLPAYGAIMPRLLPAGLLQAGNALNMFSQYAATVAGPLLAGLLVAAVGPALSLWIDVATFAASVATLALVRDSLARQPPEARQLAEDSRRPRDLARRGLRDLTEGLRATLDRPWVAASIVTATLINSLTTAPAILAAPIVARERFGGAAAYGAMWTAIGAGAIAGSIVGGRLRTSRPGLVGYLSLVTVAGSTLSLAFLPLPGVLVFWALAGAGVTVFQILFMTALQKDIPEHLLGRVMALDMLGSQGLMPLGYGVAGIAIAAFGTRDLLVAGAAVAICVCPAPLFIRGGITFSSTAPAPAATVPPAAEPVP